MRYETSVAVSLPQGLCCNSVAVQLALKGLRNLMYFTKILGEGVSLHIQKICACGARRREILRDVRILLTAARATERK